MTTLEWSGGETISGLYRPFFDQNAGIGELTSVHIEVSNVSLGSRLPTACHQNFQRQVVSVLVDWFDVRCGANRVGILHYLSSRF